MVLEIIHLRAEPAAVDRVLDMVAESPWVDHGVEVCVYRRDGLPGDVSVHIHGTSTERRAQLAEQIASELRAFGIVQHTRWKKQPTQGGHR